MVDWSWWWSFHDNHKPPRGGEDKPLGGNDIPIIPYRTQFMH